MEITKETLDKFGVTKNDFASMLICLDDIEEKEIIATIEDAKNKGYIYKYSKKDSGPYYYTSDKGRELLETMSTYEATKNSGIDFIDTAAKLRLLFPRGMKPGTNSRWVDGVSLVAKRLKQFVIKYGEFSEDEILDAAKRYIDSFKGDYSKMRTLRYFIWADKRNPSTGEVEYTSDLLSFIEDKEDEDIMTDWEVQLR